MDGAARHPGDEPAGGRSGAAAAGAGGDEGGQAAVELALALPVVVLLLLGMLQVALVGRDQLAVELAAREAARAAAVSADPVAAARLAAERVTTLRPLQVAVSAGGDAVTVTVRHPSATTWRWSGASSATSSCGRR